MACLCHRPLSAEHNVTFFYCVCICDVSNLVISVWYLQIVVSLEKDVLLNSDPEAALKNAFVQTNAALLVTKINYVTSGCTCVTVYVRDKRLYVANCGDSRAVMAYKPSADEVAARQAAADPSVELEEGELPLAERFMARDLTRDHKPDDPEEMARIIAWGGYVCPPAEVGLSARVYLDPNFTMIGLAMARSIGKRSDIEIVLYKCLVMLEPNMVWRRRKTSSFVDTNYSIVRQFIHFTDTRCLTVLFPLCVT